MRPRPSLLPSFPLHRSLIARGFTLIELMVCVVLTGLLLTAAAPDLRQWLHSQRLQHAAQSVAADLQLARSEALQISRNVMLRFGEDAAGGCYVLYTGPVGGCACQASAAPLCDALSRAIKQAQWPRRQDLPSVRSNTASMLFSGRQGTVSMGGTIEVRLVGLGEVRHVVSITGRVRTCASERALPRLPRCA